MLHNAMNNTLLTLNCLVDGGATVDAFPVEIESTKTIGNLRQRIKAENPNTFMGVDAKDLTLWFVSIPKIKQSSAITIGGLDDKTKLNEPQDSLSLAFPHSVDDNTYILVQRTPSAVKRDREEDLGPSSKRKRHRWHSLLLDAIEEAGLTEKAVVDGESDLSRLDNKERVSLLNYIGQGVDRTDSFASLFSTAHELHGVDIGAMDKLSAPQGSLLPIIRTNELFIRRAYKDLYDTILGTFENACVGNETEKHVVVTGTSDIGKSAFLVYLAIRLLAESDDDNPPIIIFHTKRSTECYVYGGLSTVQSGSIEDFKPFLNLPDTWYFVDSSPYPILGRAKTVISASPNILFSEAHQYKDIDKMVAWRYYMAPWSLEELIMCWTNVTSFQVVPLEALGDLYAKIGGVPRYVLERPMKRLNLTPDDLERAKAMACEHLEQALERVRDPATLVQFFSQGNDPRDISSRLIHRWPVDDYGTFRLEWASAYVAEKVATLLTQDACTHMLKRLIADPSGSYSGIMFEAYVLRAFREGGHTFEIKNLETGLSDRLHIPRKPQTEHFSTISSVTAGTLCIPRSRDDACVDLLLAPRDLFQTTVSRNHPIKGPPLSKLIGSFIQADWISLDEPRLIFVVPSQVYDSFEKQKYLTSDGKVHRTVPADIMRLKQFVLKIDLESAAAGKSPGLQIPVQQDADTLE